MKTPRWALRTGLGARFWEDGKCADCPVIDAHAHMGAWNCIYFPAADAAAMTHRMDRAGVRTVVFSHHAALSSPDLMNRPAASAVQAFPDRFKAYCVYHPRYPTESESDLAGYDAQPGVYVGLKLHGDMHGVPYTDARYAPAWVFADRRGLPVLVHSWGGLCERRHVGHANGRRQVSSRADHRRPQPPQSLGRRGRDHPGVPHVHLDLCAVLDERTGVLERFVGEAGSDRVLFGTDIPWFDFHYYIAGVVAADIAEDDMRNILYRNARKLFGLPGDAS